MGKMIVIVSGLPVVVVTVSEGLAACARDRRGR
jgi:hypothetical protein